MQLKTIHDKTVDGSSSHVLLTCSATGEMFFCGASHCSGVCGFPALVLDVETENPSELRRLKAHSSMVAVGPVWQYKAHWKGPVHVLATVKATDSELGRYWW